ncbi:hypothetical protein F4808DRAFT_432672 [Astrocystis sublimbata]|nr:hypothetical protein F4808DRAFT_432672 [Astrocystis sublimbata]
MDPFIKLPPELRLQILIATNHKRWILQLIRASPSMLRQYVPHKEYIYRKQFDISTEFDNEMLNDAVAIIRFPSQHIGLEEHDPLRSEEIDELELTWSEGFFVRPAKEGKTHDELIRLYHKLVVFVEDYLTKATAAWPAKEYWCLPHPGGQLMFKDRAICARFDLAQCNSAERRRLFKAFLKFELISRYCYLNGVRPWDPRRGYHDRVEVFMSDLPEQEIEGVHCVEQYFRSLYKAVLIQCGNSELPETPAAWLATQAPDDKEREDSESNPRDWWSRWYPDVLGRLTLSSCDLCHLLACCGLDEAINTVKRATAGQHGRASVGEWLKDCANGTPEYNASNSTFGHHISDLITKETPYWSHVDPLGPSLHRRVLHHHYERPVRPISNDMNERNEYYQLYRSRAWIFLDDERLFKSDGNGPGFPAFDVLLPNTPFDDIIGSRLAYRPPRSPYDPYLSGNSSASEPGTRLLPFIKPGLSVPHRDSPRLIA